MALEQGTRFGPYEVAESIGAGGMGEVYRAKDTELKRDVALKVLPPAFVEDADRLARFQREAEILASLNHPNIAQVYGLERADGQTAIAMELVEGTTLADRIKEGPIPPDEAMGIALQVVAALEAAHAKQIVHRDLKPANVKVREDGTVKVLDFGISKPIDPTAISGSPVMTTPAVTQTGVILGTAAYMSPEQARGRFVDQRTDVWAFGCLLFEMLTGQPAFGGEDVMLTLARVLANETNLDSIPSSIAPHVRQTIELCLRKEPKKRFHSIGDVRLALEGELVVFGSSGNSATSQDADGGVTPATASWSRPLPVAALGLLLGVVVSGLAFVTFQPEPEPKPLNRFSYQMPEGLVFRMTGENVLAVAPDGRHFALNTASGLFIRPMDSLEGRLIPGTEEQIDSPFFSPDGQSIGYRAAESGQLKRIGISGGAPVVIANDIDSALHGANWATDGTIIYAEDRGVFRVPANGGTPELLFPTGEGERFNGPQLLPDGDTVIYSVAESGGSWDRARIVAQSISTDERRVLLEGGSSVRYVETGHLVYVLGADLFAQALHIEDLTVSGPVVPLVQGVSRAIVALSGLANYGVTDAGTLIYLAGDAGAVTVLRTSFWIDGNGRQEFLGREACTCIEPKVSPDGARVAFTRSDIEAGDSDIWIWSIAQQTFTRLTFEPGVQRSAVWSPDGESIAYGGSGGIYVRRADGTGAISQLLESVATPFSWSREGVLVYTYPVEGGNDYDVGVLLVNDDDPMPQALLETAFDERHVALSPDGRWLAYESDESGQDEIYVRPFPEVDDGRWQVSGNGGREPQWAPDGSALLFVGPDAIMRTTPGTGEVFSFTTPEAQLELRPDFLLVDGFASDYAISLDGEQLLMLGLGDNSVAGLTVGAAVVIVENWTEELKRLVPVD